MTKLVATALVLMSLSSFVAGAVTSAPNPPAKTTRPLKPRPTKVVSAPVVPAELSADHHLVAQRVVVGLVPCELGAKVHVKSDKHPSRFIVELGRQSFRMEPALTTTGAVRLEDPTTGTVWLQLGNKSMLLNTKVGKRLADSCVNPQQLEVANALEQNKPLGLLENDLPVVPAQ